MGGFADVSRIEAELMHHVLTLEAGYGKHRKPVVFLPSPVIVEVPYWGVDLLRFVRRVVRLVENECTNGVETCGGEIGLSAIHAEPWCKGDEVVVRWGEIIFPCDIGGDEVVLQGLASGVAFDVGNVQEPLYCPIESVGVGGR